MQLSIIYSGCEIKIEKQNKQSHKDTTILCDLAFRPMSISGVEEKIALIDATDAPQIQAL